MFGKILRAGKGGHGCKYKIDLQITQLENLPTSIKKCRVVWARSAKLQITDIKDVRGSVASFKQTLTQVTTIYRDKSGRYEAKEYEFKVQVPGKSSSDSPVTIGKATMDMAKYCKEETTTQPAMLPIPFKVGGNTTGYLRMTITTVFLGDSNEDGLTEVSGLTGLTSDHGSVREQDLEGFADEELNKYKKTKSSRREDPASSAAGTSSRSSKSEAARRHKPLPPTAEEDASDLEEDPEPAPAAKALRKKPSARQPEIEEPEEEANPFAKRVSKPPSKRAPPPKVWDDDEEVSPLNSDISDSEAPKPDPKASKSAASKSAAPDESLDDMKASLFATKKPAAATAGRGAAGQSSAAASASAASSKSTNRKSGRAVAPPPPLDEDDDEDSLRNDLFTAKPKASAAAVSSRPRAAAVAAATTAATAGGALVAAEVSGGRHHKSKAAPPPRTRDDDVEEDDDDYGPSTSAAAPAPKSRSKADSKAFDAVPEPPVLKGSSSLTRAGSSKPDAVKGGSTAELENLRQRVAQLEQQLSDERVVKDELNKKVQKYSDKIADLEDQLAEGDVTELYAQMREMEAKHQAEIKEMEVKYQAEIKELMERHLSEIAELEDRHHAEVSELQEAVSVSGRGGASSEELKHLQAEVAEQEALLKSRTAKLEAEQAAANAARQTAEAKLAEANKMIDDSLLVATKHQQENKALQEEISRLKRQLEDASMWETGAAVAAITAASNNGRRSSEDEAELEELRERMEELQEENARLQKLNEVAQGTAASILSDIRMVVQDVQGPGSLLSNTGLSPLDRLAVEVRCLCDAYTHQSTDLRKAQDRFANASARTSASGEAFLLDSAAPAKVKPHELLSRVQQLTAERDSLQDKLASQRQAQAELVAAQKLVEELRQQVDTLTFEKEAVERFKVATIHDLRRQNDELRSSLRTLSSTAASPRTGRDEELLPASTPQASTAARAAFIGSASARAAGAAAAREGEGNWNEFEALVAQLKADRADLRRQVEQLKADKAALGREVEDLRSAGGAPAVAAVAATAAAAAGAGMYMSGDQSSTQRSKELVEQCASLEAEVARLQAQLAELSEADTIIKEWSDYADGLVAEKTRLEQQVQELTQRLGAGSLASDVRAADAERRMADWQRRAADAERKSTDLEGQLAELTKQSAEAASRAVELERQAQEALVRALEAEHRADAAESRALDAESRASAADVASVAVAASTAASPLLSSRQQPADTAEVLELRRQIARLEESLSGLRIQLIETHSNPAMSARTRYETWDGNTSREAQFDAAGSRSDDEDAESDVSGGDAGPRCVDRGWHRELEELRARNASLEATVAGLQASLEIASQQAAHGGNIRLSSRKAEQQIQELQSRLAQALQEKAELESTLVLLRAELERVPLVARDTENVAAEDSAADGLGVSYSKISASLRAGAEDVVAAPASPGTADGNGPAELQQQIDALEAEVAQLRKDRSDLRASIKELRLDLRRLEEEKNDSDATINRLSVEMEELAEALEASNSENERLSLEVLNLRDQLEQFEGGEDGPGSRSQSEHSAKHGPSRIDSGGSGRLQGRAAQSEAERELVAVRAAARDVIRQVAMDGGYAHDGFDEEPAFSGVGEDDLVQALKGLRGQIAELQRQSRQQQRAPPSRTTSDAAAVEAQLTKATARIDELQQLLEDAEIENQHLTEQLEEYLTGGRKGPDSVGSVAEECQSSYGGSVAAGATGASNPYSYGHANALTLSAFEQRLAMAEGQRDELSASLADAYAANKRLEADVATLQKELASARRGLDPSGSGGLERSSTQVNSRGRGSRGASDSEDKKRLEELQSANRKLEAVCDDLEEKAQLSQEMADRLQAELMDAKERIRDLEAASEAAAAAVAASQKRLDDELSGAGGRQSKDKTADLEARVARLSRENAALEDQLEDERAMRNKLEMTLKDKLDRDGDDEAAETVAAFEVKYNRLKERYKMLEKSSQEELDELQDQLTEAVSQVTDLQRQVKQLQSQVAQVGSSRTAAATSSANMEELRNLRTENERLVQQLVAKKMELAELSESEITMKRELARLHEVNMKLAQKATTLEAQAAMAQAASGGKGGRGRK